MNDDRLGRRALLLIGVAALATAGAALLATTVAAGSVTPRYTATTVVALIPGSQLPAQAVPSFWDALSGGQAGRVAAEILKQPQWRDAGARAAGVEPTAVTVTAGVVDSTQLIDVTVQGPTARAAEIAAVTVVTQAKPLVQQVSGPYTLLTVQPATGTAVRSDVSRIQLDLVAALGGLLLGGGAGLVTVRVMRRAQGPAPTPPDAEEPRVEPSTPPDTAQPAPNQPVPTQPVRRDRPVPRMRPSTPGVTTNGGRIPQPGLRNGGRIPADEGRGPRP